LKPLDLFGPLRPIKAKSHLFTKETAPRDIHYLHSGVCIGYDLLADGRRQIISIYLAGDLINCDAIVRPYAGQNVAAISDAMVATIDPREAGGTVSIDDALRELITQDTIRRKSMLEVWVCALGRKSAIERMAMFFCELHSRMRMSGQMEDGACSIPLNQIDLADILGLSVVHVNRVLRTMRETRLATFDAGRLDVLDFERLAAIAEFDVAYLL
jgi:CRP-like cAMP-binding protein